MQSSLNDTFNPVRDDTFNLVEDGTFNEVRMIYSIHPGMMHSMDPMTFDTAWSDRLSVQTMLVDILNSGEVRKRIRLCPNHFVSVGIGSFNLGWTIFDPIKARQYLRAESTFNPGGVLDCAQSGGLRRAG